ncbi:unnamed protein product [Lampetra fluviatilis]
MDKGLMRQAEHIWGALDELAISDPTAYKNFIQHQLKGARIPSSAAIPDPRQPAVEKLRAVAAPRGTFPATILTRPPGEEEEEGISDGEDGSRLALKLTASPACKRRNNGKLLIEELPTSPPERPEPTPIDCTEGGLPKERLQEPKYTVHLEESEDCAPRYIVTVSLPDVTTINDCNLGISFMPGITVKDVNQQEFVKALAAFLKKSGKLKKPDWVDTVKLAKHKELAPYDGDWYYVRAASVVRHLYLRGGVGVGAMTKIYGGRQRNGTKPSHFSRGSKNVARKVLQSLESLKMVEKDPTGGRRLTPTGQRDLDRIAGQVAGATPKKH